MDCRLSNVDCRIVRRGSHRWRSMAVRANRHSRAFTLLEVVLAVSLTVLLAGSVFAFYFLTLKARDTLNEESGRVFAQRRALDLIAEDLRLGINVGLANPCQGSSEKITIMRARVPSPAVFYQQSVTRVDAADTQAGGAFELQADYELVSYYLQPPDPDDEEDLPGPLMRSVIRALRPGAVRAGVHIEEVALTDHVKFLFIEYYSDGTWTGSWNKPGFPKAIRITLGGEPLSEESALAEEAAPVDGAAGEESVMPDYPYPTVWREIAIPAAAASARGGAGGGPADAGDRSAGRTR